MSDHISWLLEVEILPGKLDEFRAVARDLIANTEPEPATLDYEWHLSPDNKMAHLFERYADSAAMIAHVEGFGAFAARFLGACRVTRFSVYGKPSAEAKAALADLSPVYFSQLGGFSR
jgi:quinol monooxygenase YgiN